MTSNKRLISFIIPLLCFTFGSVAFGMQLEKEYKIQHRTLNAQALKEIERTIGYSFKDKSLLIQAFTTRAKDPNKNYERLEYLGDAVLEVVIVPFLMQKYPKAQEGQLTEARCALVSEEPLAALCQRLGLQNYIQHTGKVVAISCVSDVLEALIGALHEDGGIPAAQDFILRFFIPMVRGEKNPCMMHNTVKIYAQEAKKNITYTWSSNKKCYSINQRDGKGLIVVEDAVNNIDKKQRLSRYCAEYEFIKNLPTKYRNRLICLALDPEYKPLPLLENACAIAAQQKAPIVKLIPKMIAKDKEESDAQEKEEIKELPVTSSQQATPLTFNWVETIRENYRIRIHDLTQKLYGKGIQYDCQQSDEDDSWNCTLRYDGFDPITSTGSTKGEAQEAAARQAYNLLQRSVILSNRVTASAQTGIVADNAISWLNYFCQKYNLEHPTYTDFINGKNNLPCYYTVINAPWLMIDIKGSSAATVNEAKHGAAQRVHALLRRACLDCIEPGKLYQLIRIQDALLPKRNAFGCLIDLCRLAKIPEPTITTRICEGLVTDGLKFQSTISIPNNNLGAKLITGSQESSKQLAEESAARKALNRVANKIIKREVQQDEASHSKPKKDSISKL